MQEDFDDDIPVYLHKKNISPGPTSVRGRMVKTCLNIVAANGILPKGI